jgi:hypothetical protein
MPTHTLVKYGIGCSCPTAFPTVMAQPAASSSTHLAGALCVQAVVEEHMRRGSKGKRGQAGFHGCTRVSMGTVLLWLRS